MKTKDENEVLTDGQTTPETPVNPAKTGEKGACYVRSLFDPEVMRMMRSREGDKQYIDFLERELTRVNYIIEYQRRTISKLVSKRAELYAANKILHKNGLLT